MNQRTFIVIGLLIWVVGALILAVASTKRQFAQDEVERQQMKVEQFIKDNCGEAGGSYEYNAEANRYSITCNGPTLHLNIGTDTPTPSATGKQ